MLHLQPHLSKTMFCDVKTETGPHILLNSVQDLWFQLVVFKADYSFLNWICVGFNPKVSLEKKNSTLGL